ncbi:MAG: hypothetical protein EXR80_08745 [Methylococcales bacterium]|nr:hypothetical protein [Methylococcales bacterium]
MNSALTTLARIVCPHGGQVDTRAIASINRDEQGRYLLNASESLAIFGCPLSSPCSQLKWLPQSGEKQGFQPVTRNTPNLCLSANGSPQGQAFIMSEE